MMVGWLVVWLTGCVCGGMVDWLDGWFINWCVGELEIFCLSVRVVRRVSKCGCCQSVRESGGQIWNDE